MNNLLVNLGANPTPSTKNNQSPKTKKGEMWEMSILQQNKEINSILPEVLN